jgi:hypothetical protein
MASDKNNLVAPAQSAAVERQPNSRVRADLRRKQFVETDSWGAFLIDVAEGGEFVNAMTRRGITQAEINLVTRDPLQSERFQQARLDATRRGWSALDLEETYSRIARGITPAQAVLAVRGREADVAEFFQLVEGFKDVGDQFIRAMRIRTMNVETELLAIADDKSGDVLETSKGPIPSSAAVGRSKLQVDTRLRLAAVWNPARFGEKPHTQVNVQVNNHAEQLELARERAKNRGAVQPKIAREAVDAVFVEKPVRTKADLRAVADQRKAVDTSWLDTPDGESAPAEREDAAPLDAMWREED